MKSRTQRLIIALVAWWLVLFGVLPILLLVAASLLTQDHHDFLRWPPSLAAYRQLFDPVYLLVLLRSLKLALITVALCLAVGYPFAWCTARLPRRTKSVILILLMIPFWTNSLVRTYAIRTLIGSQGLLNQGLLAVGLIDQPLQLLYTDAAVLLGLFYLMLPFMILPLYANLEKFDYRLVEAGRDLGAGFWRIFWRIVWPLSLPGVLAGCILVFVPTMGLFYVSALLGGARQLLVGNLIQQQFGTSRDWPFGAAVSLGLMLLTFVGIWVLRKTGGKEAVH